MFYGSHNFFVFFKIPLGVFHSRSRSGVGKSCKILCMPLTIAQDCYVVKFHEQNTFLLFFCFLLYITIENGRILTVFTVCNLRSLSTTFSSRPFLWPINHLELPIFYYGSTMFVENVVVYVMFVISQNCGNLVKYHLLYCP